MSAISRGKLQELTQREERKFVADHPRSAELYARAQGSLLGGVPMNWMKKWAGAFPVFVARAKGAHFTDVDGREYVDLCLGDTGAMTGHSPDVVADAIARRVGEGITLMLPTEDSLWVGGELNSYRREPVCDPHCAGDYRADQDPGLQLLLSRNGGRIVRGITPRCGRTTAREYRAASKSSGNDPGGRIQ
jgi:hypothetical protein